MNTNNDFLNTLLEMITSVAVLRQLAAIALAILLGWLLQWIFKRQIGRLIKHRQSGSTNRASTWLVPALNLLKAILTPLITYLLIYASISLFTGLIWGTEVLVWASPLIQIWLFFRLLRAILDLRLLPDQARVWGDQILRPVFWLIGLAQALGFLDDFLAISFQPSQDMMISLRSLIIGGIIFYIFFLASRNIRTLLRDTFFPRAGLEPALSHAISTLIAYALLVAGFLMGVSAIGIDLTTLTVVIGGLSVGIGFGLQELINNFISGFILLFERTISPGDVVEVDEMIGKVSDIGIRSMVIRTPDNIELIVPNGKLLSNVVTNFSHTDSLIRDHILVSVSYDSNPKQVEQLLMQAARIDAIATEPAPRVLLEEFGDHGIHFNLMIWHADPMRSGVIKSDIRQRIWALFKEHNIEIPYPQQDLHIRSASGLAQTNK